MSDTSEKIPPFVTITNPVTYFKLWWEKVMNKEGIYFSFRIHPITAFLVVFAFSAGMFGAGRYSVNIPFLNYEGIETPIPSSTPLNQIVKETAFTGKLQFSDVTNSYFLVTTSSQAITLILPENLDLKEFIGKRILVIGDYDKTKRLINVGDVKDMEILPKSPVVIPTLNPILELNTNIPEPNFTPSQLPVEIDRM